MSLERRVQHEQDAATVVGKNHCQKGRNLKQSQSPPGQIHLFKT